MLGNPWQCGPQISWVGENNNSFWATFDLRQHNLSAQQNHPDIHEYNTRFYMSFDNLEQ